jgi:filamentous hemagglutinin
VADIGFSLGWSGETKYSGPATVNYGIGRYLGIQFTPSNISAYDVKSWYDPTRYVNGIAGGLGLAIPLAPVTISADPTYQYSHE